MLKSQQLLAFLTFMSGKNNILSLSELYWYFYTYVHLEFHAQLS